MLRKIGRPNQRLVNSTFVGVDLDLAQADIADLI